MATLTPVEHDPFATTPMQGGGKLTPVDHDPFADAAHQQARAYINEHPELQHGFANSMAGKAVQGMTFGWGDELMAGAGAARDWMRGKGDIKELYALHQAMQDEQLKDASKTTGGWGTAAEMAGGVVSGMGAAKAGATLMRPGQGLMARIGAGAAEGAGYGALSGAGMDDKDKIGGALKGGAAGLFVGGAMPAVVSGIQAAASPVVSNISARINPKRYAENQLAKTLERSGRSAADVTSALSDAAASGQSNYVLADALGESGQKQLGGLMKSPSAMKQQASDWLTARNHGMGRQVGGFVDDAFNTHGNTADEFTTLMDKAREKAGDIRYGAARQSAGPVDLNNAISVLEDIRDPAGVLSGSVTSGQSAAPAGVERAAKLIGREGIGSNSGADFGLVLDTKRQIGDIVNEAVMGRRGYEAGQVGRVKAALDQALSKASPGYRRANDTFSRMSRPIEAVPIGQKAATSGRAANNINRFNRMDRPGQQGFRVGYADKLNESLGGPTVGGKINEMLHGDVADEIAAFATPGKSQTFADQLRRSAEMIRTGNVANGGSPTAELLSQQSDLGIDPVAAAGHVMSGNVGSALKSLAGGFMNGMNGNTEAVRNQLIPMLLSGKVGGGPNVNLGNLLRALEAQSLARQQTGASIRRGISSGVVPALVGGK